MTEIGKIGLNTELKAVSNGAQNITGNGQVSILGSDKAMQQAKGMGTAVESSTISAHSVLSEQLKEIFTVKGILHKIGAVELEPTADKFTKKGFAITGQAVQAIAQFDDQIKALRNDKSLKPEEIESKIKLIEAKMAAIQKEASAKLDILTGIAKSLPKFAGLIKEMKEHGISTDILTEVFDKILEGMSSQPSNLKDVNSNEDLEKRMQENMKNLLGPESDKKMENLTKDIDNKIEKAGENLKDPNLSKEEKARIKVEIKIYRAQKEIIQSVASKLQSYSK